MTGDRRRPSTTSVFPRWSEFRNRLQESPDYPDEWWVAQCGRCEFWIPLAGVWGVDYGACANRASEFDAQVRNEHDGCEAFTDAVEWAIPEDYATDVEAGDDE
jgi:hypothetical protein